MQTNSLRGYVKIRQSHISRTKNKIWCLMLTCRNALPQSVCFFVNYDELLAVSVLMETAPKLFHCGEKAEYYTLLNNMFTVRSNWNTRSISEQYFQKYCIIYFNCHCTNVKEERTQMWVYLYQFLIVSATDQ